MDFAYTVAAFAVVPGILGLFHWLSRTPGREGTAPGSSPTGQSHARSDGVTNGVGNGVAARTIAEEAESWLRAQR